MRSQRPRPRANGQAFSRFGLLELSRQRLKPALGESSHMACPRCAGTGVIRGIESLGAAYAAHHSRRGHEGQHRRSARAGAGGCGHLPAQRKRAELFGLEERLDVSVFLIPNTHLENPHYEISRVRTDDVDEDAAPSYQRVIEPEKDDNVPFGQREKAKAARPSRR